KNGLTASGLIAAETSTSITLVGIDGKSQVILRTDLEELFSSGKSAMPEGLEKDITREEMADLIEFIRRSLPVEKSELRNDSDETARPFRARAAPCERARYADARGASCVRETDWGAFTAPRVFPAGWARYTPPRSETSSPGCSGRRG